MRGASYNSWDDPEFEAEAADDWFVGAEFGAGSLDGVTVGSLAAIEAFCVVSCEAGVTDFLLRKRVAAPRSVPTITTIMAAIFQ